MSSRRPSSGAAAAPEAKEMTAEQLQAAEREQMEQREAAEKLAQDAAKRAMSDAAREDDESLDEGYRRRPSAADRAEAEEWEVEERQQRARERRREEQRKDPIHQGTLRAKALMLDEQDEREARLAEALGGRRKKRGKRRTAGLFRRNPQKQDTTILVDSEGKPIRLRPDQVLRWVRQRENGKPDSARVADFHHYGYQILKDPVTDEPVTSHLGVAMVGSVDAYARRVVDYMPEGAINRRSLVQGAIEVMKDINDEVDAEAVHLSETDGHGKRHADYVDGPRRGRGKYSHVTEDDVDD